MSQKFEKLKTLLKELFQLDQPDLDFGLYRIMHAKAGEVTQFLDRDLLPQVRTAFEQYQPADKAVLQTELEKVVAGVQAAGMDPEQSPKVQELRQKLANEAVDIGALESEVYDHLHSFFRRYYSEGDFLAKRVYKPGVYAIPYEGEEVTLHWANKDQYYIKTSEYLRDYAFRLRPEDEKNPMRVHFRLADVAEGEHGNVKAAEGKDRVFILAAPGESGRDFIAEENGELSIRFEYRPASLTNWPEEARDGKNKPPAQKDLTGVAVKRVLAVTDVGLAPWIAELAKPHMTAGGEQADYNRLEAHVRRYTARNTFDYFIHKDLGTFLRRELDFYIKNEVMHLDDVENETAPKVEQYLSKIKIIRKIAGKIIAFLAQLEDFQKKLWLKKKFVVETQYCITLNIIPEALYPEIAANDSQRVEWVKLYTIDEIKGDLSTPGYSKKLKSEFLKAHPTMFVDTRHFDADFTARLLEAIGDVNEQTDGVLFHSENFQALNLMRLRYRDQIEGVHIDPPYNTQTSGFLYRNTYQHSSWLAMMAERLEATRTLLTARGALLCHIDENEYELLHVMCEAIQLPNGGTVVWDKRNPMLGRKGVATQHEYVLWRTFAEGPLYLRNAKQRLILKNAQRIIAEKGGITEKAREEFTQWISRCPGLSGGERANRYLNDDGRVYQSAGMSAPEMRSDPKFFVPLVHPKTGKPCPVPPYGWSRTPETFKDLLNNNDILFGEDESVQPRRKVFLTEDSQRQVSSVIQDAGRGKSDMDSLGLDFPYCHPLSLYVELVGAAAPSSNAIVLDFFAGSGTNGHAVVALNREEGSQRKFLLVEVGEQFDTVRLPRIKKVTFTPEWKDGKPKRMATQEEAERSPRIVKVIRLESYEDALNNLDMRRTKQQQSLLDSHNAQGTDGLKEQYILRYLLDVETRGSQSLLNIAAFTDPTAYKLKVKRPGSDESREVNVDLLETFNYLIGLTVQHIAAPQTFSAQYKRDDDPDLPDGAHRRLLLNGRIKQEEGGRWWFRTVSGTMPDGRKTLVIWRKRPGVDAAEGIEQDNLVLDEWFTRQGYSSKDSEFDLIYVNGDNNLENLKAPDDTWKVRLIEEEFHRLMFEEGR